MLLQTYKIHWGLKLKKTSSSTVVLKGVCYSNIHKTITELAQR